MHLLPDQARRSVPSTLDIRSRTWLMLDFFGVDVVIPASRKIVITGWDWPNLFYMSSSGGHEACPTSTYISLMGNHRIRWELGWWALQLSACIHVDPPAEWPQFPSLFIPTNTQLLHAFPHQHFCFMQSPMSAQLQDQSDQETDPAVNSIEE